MGEDHDLPALRGLLQDAGEAVDEGSIAGWTWGPSGPDGMAGKLLVRTGVDGLLAVGAYAATELFLGGVPTALTTGGLAADLVLGST